MKIHHSICLVTVMSWLCATAVAASRWQVDPAQLPPGLTPEKAVAMLEEIDRKTATERADEEAAQRRKAERVQHAAKKYEERLARAVENDPELSALKEKIETGMKALDNPQLSEQERTERLDRMAPDLQALRSKGLAKAGIDQRAMNDEIRGALGGGVQPRGEDAAWAAEEVLQDEGGAFYYIGPDEALPPASGVTTRGTSTQYLRGPWPYAIKETRIGDYGGYLELSSGIYATSAGAHYAGYGTNRRGVAHYLTVPSGTTRITVTAQLPDTYYRNRATGVVLGGGQARTSSKIEVWDGSTRLCRQYKLHADVWAVVVGDFTQYGTHNIALNCEFPAPAAGRDIVILHVSDVFVQAWGLGRGVGGVSADPADVKIVLESPIVKRYYSQ